MAIIILNQVIRPFTAKWHRLSEAGAFSEAAYCLEFRDELRDLQDRLEKLQQSHPIGEKGFTKAGIRKLIARLNEELAIAEAERADAVRPKGE